MKNDIEAIEQTLVDYASAYAASDIEAMMGLFSVFHTLGGIGTGGDEYLFGHEATRALFERNFKGAEGVRIDWGEYHVEVLSDAAWVQAKAEVSGAEDGKKFSVPLRWSIVLVREQGKWKWSHRHVSVAAGSQEEGTAYPGD
jgi:ketosteroid isomerase-like protein